MSPKDEDTGKACQRLLADDLHSQLERSHRAWNRIKCDYLRDKCGNHPMKEYVAQIDGAYRISDSRVSLDSVVYAWRDGLAPENIRANFPVLTLEEVYGAITFYLANQAMIDAYLSVNEAKFAAARQQSLEQLRQHKPHLYARLLAAKRQQAAATSEPEPAHP